MPERKLQCRRRQIDTVPPADRIDATHLVEHRRRRRLVVVGGARLCARIARMPELKGAASSIDMPFSVTERQQLVEGALLEQGVAAGQHDAVEIGLAGEAQRSWLSR